LEEKVAVYKSENTAVGIRHGPRGTLYKQKLALTSPTSGSRSVRTVRSQTQATEFGFQLGILCIRCFPINRQYLYSLLPENTTKSGRFIVNALYET
jgi:hypothetical protein